MFTGGLSDLLLLEVGSLVVFVLRDYILKVHMLISFEHKLYITGFLFRIRTQVPDLVLRASAFT
jgi:hypothetical protein